MGGRRDENLIDIGGGDSAPAGVAGNTSCVPNDWPYGRLDTELSRGMDPASTQATPPSFDKQRIGNAIVFNGVGSPGRVEELDWRFGKERHGWKRRVQYM